jgi:hypothetical protein
MLNAGEHVYGTVGGFGPGGLKGRDEEGGALMINGTASADMILAASEEFPSLSEHGDQPQPEIYTY